MEYIPRTRIGRNIIGTIPKLCFIEWSAHHNRVDPQIHKPIISHRYRLDKLIRWIDHNYSKLRRYYVLSYDSIEAYADRISIACAVDHNKTIASSNRGVILLEPIIYRSLRTGVAWSEIGAIPKLCRLCRFPNDDRIDSQ